MRSIERKQKERRKGKDMSREGLKRTAFFNECASNSTTLECRRACKHDCKCNAKSRALGFNKSKFATQNPEETQKKKKKGGFKK